MAASRQRKLLQAGSRAPDFRLQRLDGGETGLREILSGGPAVVAFFKITCPVCQLTFPFLDRLQESGRLPVYGISQNDAGDTREFNRQFRLHLPQLLDSEESGFPVSNAYGISGVPTLFLIGSDGIVSRVIEGWNRKEVESLGVMAGVSVFRQGDNVPEWKAG
jgi:peroxiredoxin